MRVLTSEEAMVKLSRRRCKRSQSAMDTSSDDSSSEDGQVASYASSVTLCAESSGADSSANDERRSTGIEHQLVSQQEMLHKLLSSSEAVSPPASSPEEIYEPPPAHTPEEGSNEACTFRSPEDAYESARTEAGFSNQYEWNAAYIHGMVRIEGKPSQAITKDQPCRPCADASKFAVCVSLMHDDPFKEFLVDKRNLCCGWCEYMKMQTGEDQQPEQRIQEKAQSPTSASNEETGQVGPEPTDIHKSQELTISIKQSEFFISGEGVDCEVITSEIPRYLGVDSLVRPGLYQDPATRKYIQGFYIIAYRAPTSAMLADIRAESATWRQSKEGRKLGHAAANFKEAYPGKQPPRYQTYHFDFEYRRN